MFGLIIEADLVAAATSPSTMPMSSTNLGFATDAGGADHSSQRQAELNIRISFDLPTDRYLGYDVDRPSASKNALIETIRATMARAPGYSQPGGIQNVAEAAGGRPGRHQYRATSDS